MNAKVRKQLRTRKQRIARRLERIDRRAAERPEFAATNIRYEIADRARAILGNENTRGVAALRCVIYGAFFDFLATFFEDAFFTAFFAVAFFAFCGAALFGSPDGSSILTVSPVCSNRGR